VLLVISPGLDVLPAQYLSAKANTPLFILKRASEGKKTEALIEYLPGLRESLDELLLAKISEQPQSYPLLIGQAH
jgi:hypothetical protein